MGASPAIDVHPMQPDEVVAAERIFRIAFGTHFGMPEPEHFAAGQDMFAGRYRADPAGALAATIDGQVVGSNIVTDWGTFGFFGPLTVHPDYWGAGVAAALMERTNAIFDELGVRAASLFTFSDSPKHLALYTKFGYWPRSLTTVMRRTVRTTRGGDDAVRLSTLDAAQREPFFNHAGMLTNAMYPGFDLRKELRSVASQNLGDVIALPSRGGFDGLAVCHFGAGSEALPDACYVKFAAARPGVGAAGSFERLLAACESLAADRGLRLMEAGANYERADATRALAAAGYRMEFVGVRMVRGESGYNRPDAFVIDDLR